MTSENKQVGTLFDKKILTLIHFYPIFTPKKQSVGMELKSKTKLVTEI